MKAKLLLASFLIAAFLSAAEAQVRPLRVGVIFPLSGARQEEGGYMLKGFELGLSELEPAVRNLIDLRVEDNQYLPRQTVTAWQKLVAERRVDLIINNSAPTSAAIISLTEQAATTLFSISVSKRLTEGKKHSFLFYPPQERLAERAVNHLTRLGAKKAAVFTTFSEGRVAMLDELAKQSRGRIDFVLDENVNPDEKDFKLFLSRLKQRPDADVIVVNLFFGQVGLFAKQVRQLGVTTPFFGFEMMGDRGEIESSERALAGSTYVATAEGPAEFKEAFRKLHPESSLFLVALSHDLALMVGEIAKSGTRGADIPQFIRSQNEFAGVLGSYKLFDPNRFDVPVEVLTVQ